MTVGKAPEISDLSVQVDDYEFSLIESIASAALSGSEPEMPDEREMWRTAFPSLINFSKNSVY